MQKTLFSFFAVLLAMVPALADGQSRIEVIPDDAPAAPVVQYRRVAQQSQPQPAPPTRVAGGYYAQQQQVQQGPSEVYALGLNNLTGGAYLSTEQQKALISAVREGIAELIQPRVELSILGLSQVNSSTLNLCRVLADPPPEANLPAGWDRPTRAIVMTVVSTYGEESQYSESSGQSHGLLDRLFGKIGIHSPDYKYQSTSNSRARVIIRDMGIVDLQTGRYLDTGRRFQEVFGQYNEQTASRYETHYQGRRGYGNSSGSNATVEPTFVMAVAMVNAIEKAAPQIESMVSSLSRQGSPQGGYRR